MSSTIAFIGGGNMARSLIGGLVADGCDPDTLRVADPSPDCLDDLRRTFGVRTGSDNRRMIQDAQVVVLAVKPQVLKSVARELADTVSARQSLVVSIAAGVREPDLRRWLGGQAAIVRAMPNTPALVQGGATALYANDRVSAEQRQQAESVLRAVGLTVWVEDESLLDAVTALSGSGPAYYFLVMEAMAAAGRQLGLPAETARLLTLQTAFGAAKMALESEEEPAALRTRVTSPGGTTERAVAVFQEGGLEALFQRAMAAAQQRSRELGDLLGSDEQETKP